MEKQKSICGSVRIFKGTYGELVYGHQFFNDGENPPKRKDSKLVNTFRDVNAIKYDNQIEDLCYQASKEKISESQLIEKLNELFPKNVNKTRINK